MDRVHWIYLAVIASALLLLFGATGLVMFTDIDLLDLARTFGPAKRRPGRSPRYICSLCSAVLCRIDTISCAGRFEA
jgi:hypothetical protein